MTTKNVVGISIVAYAFAILGGCTPVRPYRPMCGVFVPSSPASVCSKRSGKAVPTPTFSQMVEDGSILDHLHEMADTGAGYNQQTIILESR